MATVKRPKNFTYDPTSIKVALLSLHFLIIDVTNIHFVRIKAT